MIVGHWRALVANAKRRLEVVGHTWAVIYFVQKGNSRKLSLTTAFWVRDSPRTFLLNFSPKFSLSALKMSVFKRILNSLAPTAKKAEDGRDMFGNRAQFVLCAMGGAVGLGNLLRFPSIVFNNYGLQFFIPYLIALIFIALPVLLLEISIGAVYRGGPVLAWHSANKRAKGIGLSVVFNGVSSDWLSSKLACANRLLVCGRHILHPSPGLDHEVLPPLLPEPSAMGRSRSQRLLFQRHCRQCGTVFCG